MSKKTMSARLQMKELMENHPEDFQKRNFCIIYFMDELRYSVVERKNIDQNAKVMETITVKDGSKKFNATLMFIGSLDECNKRLDGLEGMAGSNPDEGPRTSSQKSKSGKKKEGSIETDLTNELKRVESLGKSLASSRKKSCDADSYHSESEDECVEMEENFALRKAPKRLSGIDLSEDDSEIGEVPFKSSRPTPATLERPSEKIEAKLDLILSRLDAIERHLSINNFKQSQETPPCVKKPKYESARRCNASDVGEISGIGSSPTSSLMHNEVNLLAIPSGGDLKKYALKVFSQLFTREEMAAGILEPSREKATGKEVLDPHRTNLLKRAITEKFGDVQMQKKWGQIRQSLNQKCLDSKRKLKSDQNVIEN